MAVRLFAVWLGVVVLRDLVGGYIAGRERDDEYIVPTVAIVGVVTLVAVLVLWFFPRSIARGLLPSGAEAPAKPVSPEAWFGIGCSLIGLWLAASAIPGLMRNLVVLYLYVD